MHRSLDRYGLSVPWRAMEDDSSLPRHTEALVIILRIIESLDRVDQVFFHLLVENDVLPLRFEDALVQETILVPVTLVEDPDLLMKHGLPATNRFNEREY